MIRLFKMLLLLILLSFFTLEAKEIKITNEPISLNIELDTLALVNLPFEPTMKDIKVLGIKKDFHGNTKGKSVYFTVSSFPMDLVIFGGEYPIYIKLGTKADKNEKIFNFFYTKQNINNSYELSRLDNQIVDIFSKIDKNNNIKLESFYKKKLIGTNALKSDPRIIVKKIESYENTKFLVEKYIITNLNDTKIVQTAKLTELKKPHLIARTFSNLYLAPKRDTVAYFIFDKTKEL